MDEEPGAIDCPLCSVPIRRPLTETVVVCPMCDAVGVPLPDGRGPVVLAATGRG